jgi:hypothetical protein
MNFAWHAATGMEINLSDDVVVFLAFESSADRERVYLLLQDLLSAAAGTVPGSRKSAGGPVVSPCACISP